MRATAIATVLFFVTSIMGSFSWADRVLCIHPGETVGYVHVEKNDLSDNSVGELHISLSPDNVVGAEAPKVKSHVTAELYDLRPSYAGTFIGSERSSPSGQLPGRDPAHLRTVRLII